tara:strand:- start:285 stop:500 length:216 start_codon:yes stop_codon:yes gene_type:complete
MAALQDKEVGRIMGKWAYIGVGLGIFVAYSYLGFKKTDSKIVLSALLILGGLAVGSKIGTQKVKELENATN